MLSVMTSVRRLGLDGVGVEAVGLYRRRSHPVQRCGRAESVAAAPAAPGNQVRHELPLDVEALEPRVDPADELRDPLEVVALGAVEHTVQQLLKRLRAQSAQAARVERTESGAVGEPVILGRVVASTERAGVSNGRGA